MKTDKVKILSEVSDDVCLALQEEATKKGMSISELCAILLTEAVKDTSDKSSRCDGLKNSNL